HRRLSPVNNRQLPTAADQSCGCGDDYQLLFLRPEGGTQMAVGKITISAINKLEGWLWDVSVMGFGARKQTNLVHYYVRYRHNGHQIVRSIGRHGALTPDTARTKAKQLLGVVAGGTDPFAKALAGEGFATAIDRYLERKRGSLKPTTFMETERYLR